MGETASEATAIVAAASVAAAPSSLQEDLAFSLDNLSLLVEDIKDGFAATMQQLVKIEGQDVELRARLDSAELATQRKMEDLDAAVQLMRDQFVSVVARVDSLELHHRQLEGQVEQLAGRAQTDRLKLATTCGDCCQHPVYDARAACQTPMTPYSCATPLSPDSGRPGTCTPSCYHGNEFQCGEHLFDSAARLPLLQRSCSVATVATVATAASVASVTAAPGATVAAAAPATPVSQGRPPCHHRGGGVCGGGGSCEAVAERSLHMSRALVDRFAHADSSGEDCELDGCVLEAPVDQLPGCPHGTGGSAECQLNGSGDGASGDRQDGSQQSRAATAARLERPQRQHKRLRVCQEIVETERKYCSCLWTTIDLIAESLKSATFMTLKDLCLIFPKCLPRLFELHSTFLGLLEDRLKAEEAGGVDNGGNGDGGDSSAKATFSAVVLDFLEANDGELLTLYRDYANDFGTAVRTIRKYQQHSGRFRKLVHSLQHQPSCEGLDLAAFLLTPVQRMPRYLLLMRQLAAHTAAGHRDRASLDSVLGRLHCLLDELNYSIQTALRQAAAGNGQQQQREQLQQHQQQQQQQRWKRSRSLPRPAIESAAMAAADTDSLLSGSSGRSGGGGGSRSDRHSDSGRHFLVAAAAANAAGASSRCRSVPPPLQQQLLQRQRLAPPPLRTESPKMGPRSRFISRQLRTADRCLSAGDILRAPPPSSLAATTAACEERLQQRLARRGTPPKSTLKESFRRMFQSRRKSSLAKLESLPTGGNSTSTFEDENGDPCTDV